MVAAIVVTALAYLHIISAMGWLGGDILLLSAIGSGLSKISPTAGLEFTSKVGPKATKFYLITSTATIGFGLGLLLSLPGTLNNYMYVGVILGLAANLDLWVVALTASRRTARLAKEMLTGERQGPPPLEFTASLRRQRLGVASVLFLLVLTLAFMVATGFPF